MAQFVHLEMHTEYSIHEGILRIKETLSTAKSDQQTALAITDDGNIFAWVKFFQNATKEGIKPILGAGFTVRTDAGDFRMLLYCLHERGYQSLLRLISRCYQHPSREDSPVLFQSELSSEILEGLLAISPGSKGILSLDSSCMSSVLNQWKIWCQDALYLGIHRFGSRAEHNLTQSMELALQMDLPLVALNAVCFTTKDDFQAHEARVCIDQGEQLNNPERMHHYSPEQYLKTQKEMCDLFQDIPEAIENTVEIAKRCTVPMAFNKTYLPEIEPPDGQKLADYFRSMSRECLRERMNGQEPPTVYFQRLDYEIGIIEKMGFISYFLIVADFIQWAKDQAIPVGPGRGSGAGSLVAYVLKITELDPIEHDLLFERFLNPERVSMPDFDIDFCMIGRDRVIDYVAQKYGRASVAQIITYGTMAARAVVRDVGRVLGHPYGFVDKLAKLIPFEVGMTLKKAFEDEPLLQARYRQEEDTKSIWDLATRLEGITRNVGRHAGGVVIAPGDLTQYSPLYCEQDGSNLVTQFDKDDIEKIGLVKFDFLGLRTLTILKWALDIVHEKSGEVIDINQISLTDPEPFAMIQKCMTQGVFQLESRGMKDLVRRLQPDCFDDLVALVALFRPGPLQSGMVDDFVDRKHGRASVSYLHPVLEPILKNTYGVILYQEQVMQIAQDLSGYSLGGADLLRRAMGKKKPEEMEKQRAVFIDGAAQKAVDPKLAQQIFDLIEKFAGYGFNKSHSAAYALISYQTAWVKAKYPEAFMAALMSSDMDHTDKLLVHIQSAKEMGLNILPPDINQSLFRFDVIGTKKIRYGLGAVKGVGQSFIEEIIEARSQKPFADLLDFCLRLDGSKFNRRSLEALIHAGSFDGWQVHRAQLHASVEMILSQKDQIVLDQKKGQRDMFSSMGDSSHSMHQCQYIEADPWNLKDTLEFEFQALGFYLSGHPAKYYQKECQKWGLRPIYEVMQQRSGRVCIAGYMEALSIRMNKNNKRFASMHIVDHTGSMPVLLFDESYGLHRHILEEGGMMYVEGELKWDTFQNAVRINAHKIQLWGDFRQNKKQMLLVKVDPRKEQYNEEIIKLKHLLLKHAGSTPVSLQYCGHEGQKVISLGKSWGVALHDDLMEQLSRFTAIEVD